MTALIVINDYIFTFIISAKQSYSSGALLLFLFSRAGLLLTRTHLI